MRRLSTSPFAAALLAATLALPMAATAEEAGQITVTGEGRSDAAPDMATISLGVTTEGKTGAEAMAANSAELAKVLANLRGAGVEDRDVQTSGLSLNPNWDYSSSGGAGRIVGYVAANQLTVRVRALDDLGRMLDAAVSDGANTLNGVSFGLSEPGPALDEARVRAVEDARARAALLAGAAGVKLGRILSIAEGGGQMPPMPMFRMEASAADAAPVPVAAGEVSTLASVTIVWEIKE